MILDRLDIRILNKFYKLKEKEEAEIWKWLPELFPGVNDRRAKGAKYNLIIQRIKRMNYFFLVEENGGHFYTLIEPRIEFLKNYLRLNKDILLYIDKERVSVYEFKKSFRLVA